jgi:hypothetical protein
MLGHRSAAMALETYADRYDDERDAVEYAPDLRDCLTGRHRQILAPAKCQKALKFRAFCGFCSAEPVGFEPTEECKPLSTLAGWCTRPNYATAPSRRL